MAERAISCMASALAALGDVLGADVAQVRNRRACLPVCCRLCSARCWTDPKIAWMPRLLLEAAPFPPSPFLQVLRLLLDRLKSDATRLTAVRALATIARSPLNIDLSPVLAAALAELTDFLRNTDSQLHQAALTALEVGRVKGREAAAAGWQRREVGG